MFLTWLPLDFSILTPLPQCSPNPPPTPIEKLLKPPSYPSHTQENTLTTPAYTVYVDSSSFQADGYTKLTPPLSIKTIIVLSWLPIKLLFSFLMTHLTFTTHPLPSRLPYCITQIATYPTLFNRILSESLLCLFIQTPQFLFPHLSFHTLGFLLTKWLSNIQWQLTLLNSITVQTSPDITQNKSYIPIIRHD